MLRCFMHLSMRTFVFRFFFVGACPKCTENSRATYTNDLVKERGIARVKSPGTRMGK